MNYKKLFPLLIFIFSINSILFSQDRINKWVIGVGANVVDIRTPVSIDGFLKDYLNYKIEDLNMAGGFYKIYVGKYINKGFSAQLAISGNTIQRGYDFATGDPLTNDSFFAIDTKVKYDVNRLIGDTNWFDPFLITGTSFAKIANKTGVHFALGWGFNAWVTEDVGINFQSDYNHNYASKVTDYFQFSFGLVYKLNASGSFKRSHGNRITFQP